MFGKFGVIGSITPKEEISLLRASPRKEPRNDGGSIINTRFCRPVTKAGTYIGILPLFTARIAQARNYNREGARCQPRMR